MRSGRAARCSYKAGVLVRAVTFDYTPRQSSSTEVPMRLIGLG
jgi:hypothetical protein